jgi:hypothetical protein
MNDPESRQGRALSTEQIAAAGAGSEHREIPGEDPALSSENGVTSVQDPALDSGDRVTEPQDPMYASPGPLDAPPEQPAPAEAASRDEPGTGDRPRTQLLEDHELQDLLMQWKDIQAGFVDEPRKAVQDADALVAELMQRLAQMFASEREQLESRWAGGEDVSTEDLRRGLRRYRSFFERLLAA